MKRTLFLFALFAISLNFTFSQSKANLDQKNGFKSYKLGTPKREVDAVNILKDLGNNVYMVTSNKDKTVFDLEVESVSLRFNHLDELVSIRILIRKGEKNGEIGVLGPYFDALYGRKTAAGKAETGGDVYEYWEGEKVLLYVYYEFLPHDHMWQPTILVSNIDAVMNQFNDGF